jgi:hypothetical protein
MPIRVIEQGVRAHPFGLLFAAGHPGGERLKIGPFDHFFNTACQFNNTVNAA